MVQVASIIPGTRAEGPGLRVAVWTQGCSIRCEGCFNPDLWGARGGQTMTVDDLVDRVLEAAGQDAETEGVTFLGGEPFDQPKELAKVARKLRSQGLSVMVFTGFTLEEIRSKGNPSTAEFLSEIDLLVDGPYVKGLPDLSRPWVGSTNQRFHFLTDRYDEGVLGGSDRIEITIAKTGEVRVNGWADVETLEALLDDVVETTPSFLRSQ